MTDNLFDDIANRLANGDLSYIVIQNAIVEGYRRRDDIPDEIKSILCGSQGIGGSQDGGILRKYLMRVPEIVGGMELAFYRGGQEADNANK